MRTSRLTARIDNNAIADGFQIYLHSSSLTADGEWAIVQQGMNEQTRPGAPLPLAFRCRARFHVRAAHGIVGEHAGPIMNLVDGRAKPAQDALLAIAREHPDATLPRRGSSRCPASRCSRGRRRLEAARRRAGGGLRTRLPRFRVAAAARKPRPAHAAIARADCRSDSRRAEPFSDPARFSFALGGKDGHPFPVPLKTYDESISVLRRALDAAKLGDKDKIDGFRRLDRFVHAIEQNYSPEANFEAVVAHEHAISPELDGRSVFDKKRKVEPSKQLRLFE